MLFAMNFKSRGHLKGKLEAIWITGFKKRAPVTCSNYLRKRTFSIASHFTDLFASVCFLSGGRNDVKDACYRQV